MACLAELPPKNSTTDAPNVPNLHVLSLKSTKSSYLTAPNVDPGYAGPSRTTEPPLKKDGNGIGEHDGFVTLDKVFLGDDGG